MSTHYLAHQNSEPKEKIICSYNTSLSYYSYLISGSIHIDDDNKIFYSYEAKPSPYQIPSNGGDSHKGQMSTGANQEQKFDQSINQVIIQVCSRHFVYSFIHTVFP